jgi:hypothetical protein
MGALIGFIAGYMAGAKAGPEGYMQLRQAWQTIAASAEFKALVAGLSGLLQNTMAQSGSALGQQLRVFLQGDRDFRGALQMFSQADELNNALQYVSQSKEFQQLVANSLLLVNNVIERGRATVTEQLH